MLNAQYLAGFFDGEGSVGIYQGGSTRSSTLRVQITQNVSEASGELLELIKQQFGGSISVMTGARLRQAYNYQTSGANAVAFLQHVRCHLFLKSPQVDAALEWWDGRGPRLRDQRGRIVPLSDETVERDRNYRQRLTQLKVV